MDRKTSTRFDLLARDSSGFLIVVLVAIISFAVFTAVLTQVLSSNVLENAVSERIEAADAISAAVESIVTAEDFEEINTAADKDTETYRSLQAHLNELRRTSSLRNFYTAKRADDGTLIYLVDGLDPDAEDFRNPGDAIEDEMIPYIERALDGESAHSQNIVDTAWGHIFTACYPVHGAGGSIIGAVCIEDDMEPTYTFIEGHRRTVASIAFGATCVALALMICTLLFIKHYRDREAIDRRRLIASYQQLEEALKAQEKHSEIVTALATIYTTIFLLDLETKRYEIIESVSLMHASVPRRGGIDDAMDHILNAFMAPDMREEMRAFLDLNTLPDRLAGTNTIMTEYRSPEGRWFQARFVVKKRAEDGRAIEALYAARDFTAEKQRELELRDQLAAAAEDARRANLSKTQFLRRMSHDIRTPLNGIIGMMHVSERYANDPEKLAESKEKILHSADYLLDLVNNVLDISKLESGALELENKPFDLGTLLLKTLPIVETNAADNGLTFSGGAEASHLVHYKLIGSPLHLNRVLMNLASNAVKYNRPGGTITLSCVETSSDQDTATYRFTCADTGLGMSREFQARAFEPFSQEGKETTTTFAGSGLGLSIVKDIVNLMGGTIELESEEGVGTTITIVLTFAIDHDASADADAPEQACAASLAGKHALLVEDNDLNREIARIMLEDQGLSVTEATNGRMALDTFEASKPDEFDYIFMDVMMPVMDGLEATRRIRALNRPDAQRIPIIAMTANAFAEDRRACMKAGMDAHIGKPIEGKALTEAIAQIERARASG